MWWMDDLEDPNNIAWMAWMTWMAWLITWMMAWTTYLTGGHRRRLDFRSANQIDMAMV